ncbi:MAG: hypothetical protein VZR02_02350 [Lachnospiraceae bacterium]|nr:hypothetical protein [Lachnospiraceae bacterium]
MKSDKKEKKRKISASGIIILLGVVAVCVALGFFIRIQVGSRESGSSASEIEKAFRERVPFADVESATQAAEEDTDSEPAETSLATLELDGHSCVGLLRVKGRDMSWVVEDIGGTGKVLPCLISGTPSGGSCTIMGADEDGMFKELENVAVGDEILFTDVYGTTTAFTVETSGTIEESQMNPTDLNLFCEKSMGRAYLVSCSRKK